MRNNRLVWWMLPAMTLMLAGAAWSAEVGGVRLDDKISVGGQELVLNGAGVRTRAIFKVYVASLYVPEKSRDAAAIVTRAPRRVQLNLLRNLSASQLVDALNDGLRDNTPEAELGAIKPQMDELTSIMRTFREVHERDVVALDFVDGATRVVLNGETKGTVQGEAFNRALLRIWLGERPVQGDLKRALLGL